MKRKYKYMTLTSEKDFRKAEKLKENGWRIIQVGFTDIIFEKIKDKNK